jgi:hypothetical protein
VSARRKASASLGVSRPSRSLDLAGKTLAGCVVDRMAANSTKQSRFHALMSCGHSQIVDGSELTAADRAKRTLKCSACIKADYRAMRKAAAGKGSGGDG